MTGQHVAPFISISIAFSSLAIGASGWSIWRVKFAYRKRGRREVERTLASRGETLVALKNLPYGALQTTTGLSTIVIFEVHARTSDGDERTYQWAYEPRVFPWQSEGIKRLAHGIWIAV